MIRSQDRIFQNYGKFLYENKEKLKEPIGTLALLTDDVQYNTFINTLLDGFTEEQIQQIQPILDHQRSYILEDAANIAASPVASAYAIAYFPILSDIYIDDILFKAITHHTTNTPIMTFPKMQLMAKVANSDGSEIQLPFPRARYMIRATPELFELKPTTPYNLFTLSHSYPNQVNSQLSYINKRYFILDEIEMMISDSTSYTIQTIPLGLRPDSRGQVNTKFEFLDGDLLVVGSVIGNINWDKGQFVYNVVFEFGDPTHSYSVNFVKTSVMFTARSGDIGRVKITMINKGWDVNVDVKEDFEFDLNVETIQEYTDIYNINLAKTISEAIKTQVYLNRDHDISQLLRSVEPQLKGLNTYETIDFQTYRDMSNLISPSFIGAVFQTVAPRISVISRHIWMNFNVAPQYILTGVRAAAALEQLQEFAVTLPTYQHGLIGFDNLHAMNIHVNVFLKSVVLSSAALDDDKLYLLYKPDDAITTDQNPELSKLSKEDRLRSTVLANIIYKPLYFIEEITNSEKRTFIRSRTALELFRPEGVGCINMLGFRDLLTSNPDIKPVII